MKKTMVECYKGFYYEDGEITLDEAILLQDEDTKSVICEPQYVTIEKE